MFTCRMLAASLIITVGVVPAVAAQGLGDRLRRRAQQAVEQKVEDKTLEVVRCVLGDTACIEKARAEGKTVETTDASGKVVTEGAAAPAAAGTSTGATATADANASAGSGALKPGEGAWVNYDFVPGTRPLFVDDFARDTIGDFPRRLEFIDGNMEVAESRGARYLRVTTRPGKFAVTLPEQMPEQFTMEFDATSGYPNSWIILKFGQGDTEVWFRAFGGKGQGGASGPRHRTQGATEFALRQDELFRARIMVDGRYLKVYMNDTRVANIPNSDLGRSKTITIEAHGAPDAPAFIGNIAVMAGGRKLYDALAETGRVATQGIYFDTGSDRVRPESTPTLKEIVAMLNEHPDLKLTIEGHTDNVGSADANRALSEKRAGAVKDTLATQFGVDPARLESKGLGVTAPAAPNDTPEGRQTNRRVELVRQ